MTAPTAATAALIVPAPAWTTAAAPQAAADTEGLGAWIFMAAVSALLLGAFLVLSYAIFLSPEGRREGTAASRFWGIVIVTALAALAVLAAWFFTTNITHCARGDEHCMVPRNDYR